MMSRRNLLYTCLFGLLLLPKVILGQFLAWDYHNIITDERKSGAYPDMAIDPTGKIHITYWNQDEDRLIYAFRSPSDTGWTREYVDLNHPNGFRSAIALDANNLPHVVYHENQSGIAQIRYAKRNNSGLWTVEQIPGNPNRGWGDYGPNSTLNMSLRVKHSLDIIIDENQKPQVVFLDGWSNVDAFIPCTSSSVYGFKLHQGVRTVGGTWVTRSFGVVPDVRSSCGPNAASFPLPQGDRYGEYCQLLQKQDNNMQVFCLSRYNNRVLNFSTNQPGNDSIWVRSETDSLGRMQPNWMWADRFFTIEGISVREDRNEQLHLSYTSSLVYGENFFAGALGSNDMVYSRVIDDTTIYYHSFGTGAYRNYTNITTQGTDSIYIVYSDVSSLGFLMQSSFDGGLTWTKDTIWSGIGTYYSPTEILGDSLNVLFFDASVDKLLLGHRHVDGGPWRVETINQSQNHGLSLDAYIHTTPSDTTFVTVFNDNFNGTLTFSSASTSGGIQFTNTVLDSAGGNVGSVSLDRSVSGTNVIAYAGDLNHYLKLAKGAPGNWTYEVVDSAGQVEFVDVQVSDLDTIHIAYYASNDSCLKYAKRHINGTSWWLENIDCDSLRVGQHPSIVLDGTGRPHIAYHSVVDKALKYARRDVLDQAWVVDSIHGGASSAIGKHTSIELDANDLPKIAYLDEQATTLWLAEQDNLGDWTLTMVDSVPVTNLGRPIELEIDDFGKVWIAYNHYSNFEKVKLLHRDSVWREVAVSTTGQIANSFAFRIVGGSLNIFGKKNILQNTGVAFIRSSNGVFVQADEAFLLSNQVSVKQYPNPFASTTTLELNVNWPVVLDVSIYDLYGRKVDNLISNQKMGTGLHSLEWDGGNLAAGMYIYVVSGQQGKISGRMVKTP